MPPKPRLVNENFIKSHEMEKFGFRYQMNINMHWRFFEAKGAQEELKSVGYCRILEYYVIKKSLPGKAKDETKKSKLNLEGKCKSRRQVLYSLRMLWLPYVNILSVNWKWLASLHATQFVFVEILIQH